MIVVRALFPEIDVKNAVPGRATRFALTWARVGVVHTANQPVLPVLNLSSLRLGLRLRKDSQPCRCLVVARCSLSYPVVPVHRDRGCTRLITLRLRAAWLEHPRVACDGQCLVAGCVSFKLTFPGMRHTNDA